MSQSPALAAATADEVDPYQRGWRAFSRLIAEGRSFSGHERNSCFLNLGGGKFADISALSDLDYLDDGRSVALVDWDHDGRLDFWLTNRTSPRVRFLHNQTQNKCQFVAVRLFGVRCNRDAIGARVELFLQNSPNRAIARQLTAGDGYLAQSTKWIHFGIAAGQQIDRLVVHWPGSEQEIFRGLVAGRHYQLEEGTATAKVWQPPNSSLPQPRAKLDLPARDPLHRTLIVGRVEVPHMQYQDGGGRPIDLTRDRTNPLLVNLWSATCVPCLTELAAWTDQAEEIQATGLDIVALSVDPLLNEVTTEKCREMLEQIGFPWQAGMAPSDVVQTFELLHDHFLQFRRDLPLPSSFLLDRHGRLAAIYKGPLPVTQLLADIAQLDADATTRRASAVPFPGRWASQPLPSDPEAIVRELTRRGQPERATEYARRCIVSNSTRSGKTLSNLHVALGEILLEQGKATEAKSSFAQALQLGNDDPLLQRRIGEAYLGQNMPREALRHLSVALAAHADDAELHYNAGIAALASRRLSDAIKHLERSHELLPTDLNTCFHLGNALHAAGKTQDAIELYRQALKLKPGWPYAANNLAWILATHSDASIRDGHEALGLAEALCQNNGHSDPSSLATLAAAYAEEGRFDEAMQANQRAIELAEVRGQSALAKRLRERQATLDNERPVRD